MVTIEDQSQFARICPLLLLSGFRLVVLGGGGVLSEVWWEYWLLRIGRIVAGVGGSNFDISDQFLLYVPSDLNRLGGSDINECNKETCREMG